MSGQSRIRALRAVRLLVVLTFCLSFLTPSPVSADPPAEASPVVDPTTTPSPNATAEPTTIPEPSPTREPEFSATAFGDVSFDQTSYTVYAGSPIAASLTANFTGPTDVEAFVLWAPTFITISNAAVSSGTCTVVDDVPDNSFTGQVSSSGVESCVLTFTLTVGPSADAGTGGDITFTTGALGSPIDTTRATAHVVVGSATEPRIAVTLSNETPGPGDTVTITVILTNPTTGQVTVDTPSVSLPTGVSFTANSGNVVCLPLNCKSASVSEESGVILGYAEHPLIASGPSTTTLTFDVTIDSDAELGVPLTFTSMGIASGASATPDSVILTVQAPAPSIAVSLSNETPGLGDTVTFTAVLTNPSMDQAETAILTAGLPIGVTLVNGSSAMTCGGATCASAPTQEIPPIVSGVANFSAEPGPTTATLTFAVDVDPTAPTGEPLTFTVGGASGGTPIPGDHSINLTVQASQPLIVEALNGTLDVPFEGEGQGVLTAINGLQPYMFSLETQATKGTATIEPDGNFTYVANPGQTGTDQFTFLVNTANSSDTAVIRITISEPAALVAESLTVDVDFNGSATGTLADQVTGGFPPYTFMLDTDPTRGQVTLEPNGSFTYTANQGESGQDTFTYTVTDSPAAPTAAASVTGQVNLIIAAPDSTPTVEPSPSLEPTTTTEPAETAEPSVTAPATTQPSATGIAIDTDPVATATTGVSQLPSTGSGTSGPSTTTLGLLALALIFLAAAACRLLRRSSLFS